MAAPFLVLDIETVLDPELPIAESSEAERLPAPPHHKVVVIGALWFDPAHLPRKISVLGGDAAERGILEEFARILNERGPTLVTWNGRGFDLPVIAMRCLRYGIALPHYYGDREVRYRFSPGGHLDVMDFVSDFGAAKPSKLDVVAKLCGMPGKVGVDGKDVGPLMHAGKLASVQAYCLCDVAQTAGVFLRVQLLRGLLSREAYLASMQALIEMIDGDERLADVGRALNRFRLLLEEGVADPSPATAPGTSRALTPERSSPEPSSEREAAPDRRAEQADQPLPPSAGFEAAGSRPMTTASGQPDPSQDSED